MKVYLLSAVGVIFLSVIVSLLVPEGKLKKSVTFVMRLICILVLIQPVTEIFKSPQFSENQSYLDYDYVCAVYSEHQSTELEKLIEKQFCECSCTVTVEQQDGEFKVASAAVEVPEENSKFIDAIYEYLDGLDYINITVYAKST